MSFEDILSEAAKKAIKAECALYKKDNTSASLADIGKKYGFPTLEKIRSWKDLYNSKGHLILPCADFDEDELMEAAEGGCILMSSADPYKQSKSLIFNLLETLINTHKENKLFSDNLAAWANKEIANYTRGNPEKLAAQLCEYGIHSGERGFCLDTPKNWKKRGYKLKDTARPFFVVTPLFTPEEEKKAEEAGQAIAEGSAEGEEGEEGEAEAKKPKRRYAIHALFCPQDTEKEREIPRRSPKKSENATRAEAMRAEAEKPKKSTKKPKKAAAAAPAPVAAPATTEADIMQLALSL